MVSFTTLYKAVLTSEQVDKILKCDHSNQKPLSSALLIIAVMLFFVLYKVILIFESDDEILKEPVSPKVLCVLVFLF